MISFWIPMHPVEVAILLAALLSFSGSRAFHFIKTFVSIDQIKLWAISKPKVILRSTEQWNRTHLHQGLICSNVFILQ